MTKTTFISNYRRNLLCGTLISLLIHVLVLSTVRVRTDNADSGMRPETGTEEIGVKMVPPAEKSHKEVKPELDPVKSSASFKYIGTKRYTRGDELDKISIEKLKSQGLIPELVLGYDSFDQYRKIARHYGYRLCVCTPDTYVCIVDPGTWELSEMPDNTREFLEGYSRRGRVVEFSNSQLKKKIESRFRVPAEKLAFYFLIPKRVENTFIRQELSAVSRLGLSLEDVVQVKGFYLPDFNVVIENIVTKKGKTISLNRRSE